MINANGFLQNRKVVETPSVRISYVEQGSGRAHRRIEIDVKEA